MWLFVLFEGKNKEGDTELVLLWPDCTFLSFWLLAQWPPLEAAGPILRALSLVSRLKYECWTHKGFLLRKILWDHYLISLQCVVLHM